MKRILIAGCQRSGTTLMGLIMDSHPLINNIDEAEFKSIDNLSTEFHACAKLPQESANVDFIKNQFKADTVVWMVRNPFDVVKSMMSLNISSSRTTVECWGATYSHVEINKILQYLPPKYIQPHSELLEKYRRSLSPSGSRLSVHGIMLSCITCWILKQACYQFLIDSGLQVIKVRYEDLTGSPKPVLANVFKSLDIEWHDDLLRHHELHSGMSIGNTLNSRAIDQSRVFYSNKYFNDTELKLISDLSQSAREKFYYPELNVNTQFDSSQAITDNSEVAYSPSWILFWLTASINQKKSSVAIAALKQLLNNYSELPASIAKDFCSCMEDEWIVALLSGESSLDLSIRVSKYLDKHSSVVRKTFDLRLAVNNAQWVLLAAYYDKNSDRIDFLAIYLKYGAEHTEVAKALAYMIGHFGSSESIAEQWACLIELTVRYPEEKYLKDVATALVNTLPKNIDGAKVLLSWFGGQLSKPELQRIFYKLIHKAKVDLSVLSTGEFNINSFSDAYIAWRLNLNSSEGGGVSESSKFSDFIRELNASDFNAVDFEGQESVYVGPERPKKLIICFTGFGSMLMHPMSLIHAIVDLDDDVGVLWLQDLNSRVFLSGLDGKGDINSFSAELMDMIGQYGAETVSVIASSGACYAALYFSAIYPVYRSVVLSPYTFLAEEKDQNLLQRKFGPLFKERVDIIKDMGELEPEIRAYFGANNENDKVQSEHLLKRKNVEMMPVEGMASHDLGDALIELGLYKDMFSWLTEPSALPS
jgi:hypothetical protein